MIKLISIVGYSIALGAIVLMSYGHLLAGMLILMVGLAILQTCQNRKK
jgi:fucose permease